MEISEEVSFEVYSVDGKLVAKHNLGNQNVGSHTSRISVEYLNDGIYLCNFKIGDKIISKKIVKN